MASILTVHMFQNGCLGAVGHNCDGEDLKQTNMARVTDGDGISVMFACPRKYSRYGGDAIDSAEH